MSKLALGLLSGLVIWGVGMWATAASGVLNKEVGGLSLKPLITKLNSARDIKKKHKELPCIGNLFYSVNWTSPTSTSITSLKNKETNGCLSVWWEKEIYKEGKWKGSWNLLWGMEDKSHGMIVSSSAKTNDGKVTVETASYILKKEELLWSLVSESASQAKEIKQDNELNKKEASTLFPKDEYINKSNGWDFDFDSKNICSFSNKCESETPEQISTHLNWKFVLGTSLNNKGEVPLAYEWVENIESLLLFKSSITVPLSQVKGHFQLLE